MGRVTSRTYNARGQETSVTLPDPDGLGPLTAPVFTKAFNARGELVSQTDAMGNITSWTYNAQGQALTQTDPDPDGTGPLPAAVTTFTYDLRGLRSSVTDASGNTTSYGYDHAGRLVESIDPRGNSSYYQYDAAGQVTRVVDRNSRKRDFSYNDLGLVTSEVWVDGFGNAVKTIVHGYDDAGRETSISDGVTGYNYQYDLADRVTYTDNADSVDMPQVQLRSYYDFEGNRVWLSDSMGGNVWYAWNNQRLQSMALFTENYKSAQVGFGYDSVGRLDSLTRTANWNYTTTINTSFTLDLLDRVTSITHEKISGEESATLSQFSYTYDANGRVVASTGPEGSLSYALDANGQLLSVTGSRTDNYSFDANGNRSSNTTAAGNLLLNDGQFSYTYDLEGNQKTKTRISDGQLTEYFWDHRNQLTKALVKDANGILLKELRFTYDVEGRRVGEWVDADGAGPEEPDQVWTVFDGVNPYMDFDGEGELQTRYLYGPGIDELFARIGTGEDPEWYLADRLGSVRQIVDASGAVLDEITYDSFGGILSETNPAQGDRFKFTGREFSPELGIYYYRARWYDPGSGRFISQDPIGFSAGDVNLYRYVGNAPGDGVDPEGLASEIWEKTGQWLWHWHHMLPYEVFTPEFLNKHGIQININDAEFGWRLQGKYHIGTGGIHNLGWNQEWKVWLERQEKNNIKVTDKMVLDQLEKMKKTTQYKKILELGKQATTPFSTRGLAKIAAKCSKTTSNIASIIKYTKKIKAIPGVGVIVAFMFLPSDITNKGWANGLLNSGLDAVPGLGLAKGLTELVTGDFIPDLDDYNPELYDAIPNLPTP